MSRLLLPRIAVVLLFAVLVGRLYELQLVDTEASKFRSASEVRTTRYLPVRPLRGEIYASDGKTLLAESIPIYTVGLRPATFNEGAPLGSPRRAEIFAQLGRMLNITSTLTISPAAELARLPDLRTRLEGLTSPASVAAAQPQEQVLPLRLTLPPAAQPTVGELLQTYSTTLSLVPLRGTRADTTGITRTLVISPGDSLQNNQPLRDSLGAVLGRTVVGVQPARLRSLLLPVPPARSLDAFALTQAYSTSLTLTNPLADLVARTDVPGYQTITLQRDIPREVAMVLRENANSLPGVVVEQDYRRNYPLSAQIPTLSHTLGYIGRVNACELEEQNQANSWLDALLDTVTNLPRCGVIAKQVSLTPTGQPRYLRDDRIGKDGVEASFEDVLRGQIGSETVIVDVLGQPVRAPQLTQPARNGYNLQLTIDAPYQQQVEQILRNWIAEGEKRRNEMNGADLFKKEKYLPIRSGAAVVLEIKTGRILALASWPSYDNNLWDPARVKQLVEQYYPQDPAKQRELAQLAPLTDRAIAGLYPPGSTLKQFDALIALQDGVITPDTKIRDPGKLLVEDQFRAGQFYEYKNAIPTDNKWLTVSDALKVSSNIFFMSVAGGNKDRVVNLKDDEKTIDKPLQIQRLAEGLGWFGFGKPTGVEIAGELDGLVPTPVWKLQQKREQWTTGDTYTTAIGQGNLLVTPLQLAAAGASIANGGMLYQPQIVKAITDANGALVREIQPSGARLPVDEQYFPVVRDGMRRSVTEGVNRAARDACSGLQIAGKTGTAEFGSAILLEDDKGNKRIEFQTHSWFVGFAPYDDPQVEVVMLSEGTGSLNDGSATIAVPAATQMLQAYFGVTPPDPLPRECQQGLPPLPARPKINPSGLPQDFIRHGQ